nr:carbohydrate-binding domain-containing protein [Acholeplasmatales bacterium]
AYSGSSFSWTNYSTSSSSQGGMGGMGMDSGNTDKGDYSTKGLKAANSITIVSGTINIEAYDDAIHANAATDIESGVTGKGNVTISGGTVTVSSNDDGIHGDGTLTISGGTVTVKTAYEGIEANQIYFNGGSTYVYATNDAVNAASCEQTTTPCIYISDGFIDLDCASGDTDTLDSNGNIKMTGGVIVIKNRSSQASSQTGGTIDIDGTFTMSGGLLLSFGTWCTEVNLTATKSSTSSVSSGTYTVKDSSGNTICTTTLSTSYAGYRIVSKLSGSYTLYNGSTSVTTF